MTVFKKATKTQSKLRMALYGVSGSGKTFSALAIAMGLGGRIALIDTERGSASKYAGRFEFDTLDMAPPFTPAAYIKAIKAAELEGYDIVVIDSLTHAWSGAGGALEMVDNAAARSPSKNTYVAWRDVTPQQNAMVDAILQVRCHVIATMRSKTEYVQERDERTGKMAPRKVGLAPVQRDGMEYEFDVVGEMDMDNNLIIQKTRCEELSGKIYRKPGADVSNLLKAWLSDGAPAIVSDQPATTAATTQPATTETSAPTQKEAHAASSSATSSADDAKKAAAELRAAAIAYKKKWTDKLNTALKTHPENAAMLAKVAADNQAKSDTPTDEIAARAKRIMVNVCNTTGEIEETFGDE